MTFGPVLALAGLAVIGLLATRLPRPPWPRGALPIVRAAGGAFLLLGLVLGPGIDFLTRPVLKTLAPVTALALGWIGATLGARFEWRSLRRLPRTTMVGALLSATAAYVVVALAAGDGALLVPALSAAWAPRLPAVLTLAAVAAASGPGAVALVARAVGVRGSVARALARVATLETACGAVALTIPLALHRPHPPAGNVELGWLAWLVFAVGSGALVGLVFGSLARLGPSSGDGDLALVAALLFGAGIGYAADLSPFVVCALAAALIVNVAPRRQAVRRTLAAGAPAAYVVLLVIVGALVRLPTAWLLVAAPVLAGLRIAAKWGSEGLARALGFRGDARAPGLATVAQGGATLAFGLNFFLLYGGQGESAGAVLTTIVGCVLAAQLAAPAVGRLALGAGSAPLTQAPALPELSPNAPVD
ncbi:MAG TPA: hypothetical protein VH158_02515 [Gemmatimonadales bacterium]|nr:hypothetical protein [Gemmatimonadales bacterium]